MLIIETLGQNVVHDLRQEIFSHLQKVPIQFYDSNPIGRIMTRLTTDRDAVLDLLNSASITLLGQVATVLNTLAILDEATSSLDPRTEVHIREVATRAMANRTALVIAHRFSTIQEMDKIVVMHDGTIRECEDHKTLLAKRGLYWMLHQLQFHGEPGAAGRNEEVSPTLPGG